MSGTNMLWVSLLCLLPALCGAGGTTSRLQVQIPPSLKKPDGYDHREALFGLPPYGGSIAQMVYYADSTLCTPNQEYTRGGYPTRDKDGQGKMEPMKAPFILMIDRGDCTFVQKVRNAQRAGAAAVIIADDTCLCTARDTCVSESMGNCESKEPIMADDGSGSDITIPSFLMFKQDADPIKAALKENTMVRMELSWSLPQPDDRVEYELWTAPKDKVSQAWQRTWREFAVALGDHAYFTPHMYVYDGIAAGCQGVDGTNECYTLCTNNGRYCSTDPDEDLDKGISGADIVTESLRRLCLWKEYGQDGIGQPWWLYVEEFLFRCNDKEELFANEECIADAMDHAGVDKRKIDACMSDSGGVQDDAPNTLLESELSEKEATGVVILPSLYVNRTPLRGALLVREVFDAVCAGYAQGSEPHVCQICRDCTDALGCVQQGTCPGGGGNTGIGNAGVSLPVFAASLAVVTVCFGCLGMWQWQRSQRQMRAQVRGIMAEYMPVDPTQKMPETVGYEEDEDDMNGGTHDLSLS